MRYLQRLSCVRFGSGRSKKVHHYSAAILCALRVNTRGPPVFLSREAHGGIDSNGRWSLKHFGRSVLQTFVAASCLSLPYLAILLLLKTMKSLGAVVRPVAKLLPPSLP